MNKELYVKLGQRICEERKRLNLTQAQLAEDIDISDTYMGAIERGERGITLDKLIRVSNRLGVSIDYLLNDSHDSTDENIVSQFRQLIDGYCIETKLMVIDVIRTMLRHIQHR